MWQFIKQKINVVFRGIHNEKIKTGFLQSIPFWTASLITGLIAVLYAKFFSLAEIGSAYIFRHHSWSLFILTPACFLLAWWIILRFAPYARGSGIPQVMAAIELATPKYGNKVDKLLSVRIIAVKIISSLVMVFGGGVVGREGPTIQIAGSVFRSVNQILPSWWPKISKKNMIMTGAAAGLAAAFNTPLGGIVFAVEELTKTHISYFKTALFTAIIIAGLTAQALLGPYLYLGYPNVTDLSSHIFIWVIIIAIVAGLAGSMMSKVILALIRWKSSFQFKWQHILYILACATTIVSLAYFLDGVVLGSGRELMTSSLFTNDKYAPFQTPVLRILGPVLSFTTGAAGGIFAPSLASGAGIGSFMAGLLQLSESNSNIIILSGMVGFLTGVTRSPFTSAILVLEMTDRHNVIFHLMIAGLMASLVSFLVDRHSFYDHLKVQYMQELHREHAQMPEQMKSG